jgi:3-oxoacyl-[acyl-carrier-protein] synthase III
MSAYLHAFGAHLPPRVVSNAELAARVGCTPEWIEGASGIRERRWADPSTGIVDLAEAAAADCMKRAGSDSSQVGLLILASGSAPPGFPAPGAELATRLNLGTTPVLDLPMASAGALFGMVLASRLTEAYGDVLVVAAEKMSSVLLGNVSRTTELGLSGQGSAAGHESAVGQGSASELAAGRSGPVPLQAYPLERDTAILFGDGAGAALVRSKPGPREVLASAIHSDGQFRESLSFDWTSPLKMNGLSVILQASRKLPAAIREVLEAAKIPAAEVSAFLLHQANQNLLMRVARSLGVPPERVFSNIARYGNTSSASLLIAAADWERSNPEPGPAVFAAFGAGLHWGALVTR